MGTFEDAMRQALISAPELQQSPGLAIGAAQTGDPTGNAQALAQVAGIAATTNAYQQVQQRHSWLGSAIGDLGAGLGTVVKAAGTGLADTIGLANKPLQLVQREYRYVRDVYQTKGVGAGLAVTLATAAGAGAGAYFGGAAGLAPGGEVGAGITTPLFPDVWDKAGKPGGGSIGSDISNQLLGQRNGVFSGVLNGVADLFLDPVSSVGELASSARTAEGAPGVLHALLPGISVNTVEGIDAARNSTLGGVAYRRALGDLADMTPAEVTHYYPKLSPIADQLGAASTADEVHQVFRETAKSGELLATTDRLPTLTLTRQPFEAVRRLALENAPDAVDRYVLRPFSNEAAGWDDLTKNFSNRKFNLMDSSATEIVRRIVRYGETDPVATRVANEFAAESDPGKRFQAFNNIVMDTLVARAHVDPELADPNLMRALKDQVSALTSYGEGVYSLNMDGENTSKLVTDALGTEKSSGVLANQLGSTAIPNFVAVKRAAQTLAGYNKIFGAGATADDWLYQHITGGIFKPLVTLSGGFGERISMAELIPRVLHNGFFDTVASTAAAHYAETGLDYNRGVLARTTAEEAARAAGAGADEIATQGKKAFYGEVSHLGAAVYSALGGDEGALSNLDRVKFSTKNQLLMDGQTIPSSISADHGGGFADLPPAEKVKVDLRRQIQSSPSIRQVYGDDFKTFAGDDPMRVPRWQASLREAAKDPASQQAANAADSVLSAGGSMDDARNAGAMAAGRYVRANPEVYSSQFARFNNEFTDGDWADHWGRIISENMFGAGGGYRVSPVSEGQAAVYAPNREIIKAIADAESGAGNLSADLAPGGRLSKDALAAYPADQQPLTVKGRVLAPDTQSSIQRIASVGHRKVLSPIINTLGREPIYDTEVYKQYQGLQSLADQGAITDEQRIVLANSRAVSEIVPMIHNTTERSQLGYTLRNFAPFYFAQEQAYKRAGRLLAEDPAAFRKYQLMMTGLVSHSTTSTDSAGNGYLVMPGTGFLTQGAAAGLHQLFPNKISGSVPSGLSGNLSSLNTVFPFVEDPIPWHKPGPVVAIPLKAIENLRPEIGPITDAVVGPRATAGSLWDQIIPNTFIKNSLAAMGLRGETVQQHNSTLSALQWMAENGQVPDASAKTPVKQAFVNRVKNQSRVLDIVKALFSAVSPASPVVNIKDNLAPLAQQYMDKYGDLSTALNQLVKDHPDATPQTVFKSTTTLGERIPAYAESQAWINQNQSLMNQFPDAAAYLVPQHPGDMFSQSVYNEQLAQGLRQRKTPIDFLNNIYTASANALFYGRDLPAHQAALDQLVKAGDTAGATAERTSFNQYIASDFGPKNPVWWAAYQDPAKDQNKQQALAGLVTIFAKGLAPDTQQSRDVAGLLGDYSKHVAALSPGVGQYLAADQRVAENQSWDDYLHRLAAEKPQLVTVINALFRDQGEKALTQVGPNG